MHPLTHRSLHTQAKAGSSANDNPLPSGTSLGENSPPVDLNTAPSLVNAGQGSRRGAKDPVAKRVAEGLSPDATMENLTGDLGKIKAILEGFIDTNTFGEITLIEKDDLAYIVEALFFTTGQSSTACLMHQLYTDKSLCELRHLFEKAIDNLVFNSTSSSISNGLPAIPRGKILALEPILDLWSTYLSSIESSKERFSKVKPYLQLYSVLSTYYEAPVSDQDFAEYSEQRIAHLEKLIRCIQDPLDISKVDAYVALQAKLYHDCRDHKAHLRKIKQDFACWLMAAFTINKGESNLLVLDLYGHAFQKGKLDSAFQKYGIEFDKEFSNDPEFVSLMFRTQCQFFENSEAFQTGIGKRNYCEKPTARVHLLQKLESLGLKAEHINKHNPILELSLELYDPELLRHLILEYKFNPYYISDTTGHSVWQILDDTALNHRKKYNFPQTQSVKFENVWLFHVLPVLEAKYKTIEQSKEIFNREIYQIVGGMRPYKKNINLQNQWGETALIHSAKFGHNAQHLFAFKELDLNIKDTTGKTALDYARDNNNKALLKLIDEHKRALTTIKLMDTLGANGKNDGYQKLIGFLYKKGSDGFSPIEKAYQAQNTLVIEAIEAYLPAISLHFGEYARAQEGQRVQLLDIKTVLKYLKSCFSKKHPEALIKLRLYAYYYYCMEAYVGLSDEALNEAIHELIALIPDVYEVDTFSQDILGRLIHLFAKTSIEAQHCTVATRVKKLEDITRKAYKNIAHWLLSPVRIKNQSQNASMIRFLSFLSIEAIHSQKEVQATGLNLKDDFFNSIPWMTNVLEFCKQNLSGFRANALTIFQNLKTLGLSPGLKNGEGHTLLHLAIEFEEMALFKHLILEESLNPFIFNAKQESSWSCASYCRNPGKFPNIISDPKIQKAFHKLWMKEIEPVLLKKYSDLPPHSAETPRIDLIAKGDIPATPENINLQNQWGETPLIFAAKYGYDVEKLLQVDGIDIMMENYMGSGAVYFAIVNKDMHTSSAIDKIYTKKVAPANKTPAKKLSKRQIAQLKAEQEKLKKQEQSKEKEQKNNATKKNKTATTPTHQRTTQKSTPPPITITIPELLNPPADGFVHQELPKEPSHLQKAKEQIAQKDKKQDTKQHKKSLLGRIGTKVSQTVSDAKMTISEGLNTVKTVVDIVKNPSQAGKKILQTAAQRLATSKEVSTRMEAQDKPLLKYPDLIELLDLVQAQDAGFHVESNIQTILEAIDIALSAHYKNPNIAFSLKDIETALKWFYPDMTVSQHGSHRTYHFAGMRAITIASHKDNEIFKKSLQDVQSRLREALLKKLGIKSYDVSGDALNSFLTDSPRAATKDESKAESSEDEGLHDS